MHGARTFHVPVGLAGLDEEDLFRIRIGTANVLWIPKTAPESKIILMLRANMRDSGHRGAVATLSIARVLLLA